jgi:choline dehydrogenase-like flavoprotein
MTKAHYDAVVIGSGAGGGVVAARLGEAGLKVLLLEEGPWVRSHEFTQRDRDMYPKLFRDGGLQATEDASILVLQGRCVGGSTVVNQADVTPISDPVLEHWKTVWHVDDLDADSLAPAVEAVRTEIGVNRVAPTDLNANNQLLLAGAAALGWSAGRFEHNRVGCIGSGYCQIGCAYDAKRSTLVTWVPRALRAGVELRDRTRVERILTRGRRATGILCSTLDDNGQILRSETIDADHVFVCAGAIHTPLILRRSRLGGRLVGRDLSLQPQAPIIAAFPRRLQSFRGIPQSAYVDEFETASAADGLGGFRVEGIYGPPGTASAFLPDLGPGLMQFMRRYDQLAAALVLVPDRPSGAVHPYGDALFARIQYELSDAWRSAMRQGLAAAAELYLEAGAESVILPVNGAAPVTSKRHLAAIRNDLALPAGGVRLVSAHPQGTARMSENPQKGVVSSRFKLHGAENVYVADASVFPTTASSHTQLPVMSMAWLAVDRFLADTRA